MVRKINTDRVYKLVRNIVVTISILALIIGSYYALNFNNFSAKYLAEHDKCFDNYWETIKRVPEFCSFYMNELSRIYHTIWISILVGIGLPSIFFGGNYLVNYLAPKEDIIKK